MEKIFSCPTIGDDQEKLMDILDRGRFVKSEAKLMQALSKNSTTSDLIHGDRDHLSLPGESARTSIISSFFHDENGNRSTWLTSLPITP
jgi:hypothetical protein